jgi:hypothetical protein
MKNGVGFPNAQIPRLEVQVLINKAIISWGKVLDTSANKISVSPQDALLRSDTFHKSTSILDNGYWILVENQASRIQNRKSKKLLSFCPILW